MIFQPRAHNNRERFVCAMRAMRVFCIYTVIAEAYVYMRRVDVMHPQDNVNAHAVHRVFVCVCVIVYDQLSRKPPNKWQADRPTHHTQNTHNLHKCAQAQSNSHIVF